MDLRPVLVIVLGATALAACGRPDASGLYLAKSDRQITWVQLSQTKDGAVGGRLEQISIGPGGLIDEQATPLDGTAANHDLMLKPIGAGSFSHDSLELNGKTLTVKARRASLKDFQTAMARLEHAAAAERRRVTEAQARQAASAVQAEGIATAPDKAARIDAVAAELVIDAAKLNAGVAGAPDFALEAAQNTARMAKMAPGQAASANPLIVSTNQIEVARTQYAAALNQTAQRGAPLATEVLRFCGSAQAAPLAGPCAKASAAATDFQAALVHAVVVFTGAKRAIQADLFSQNEMLRKMGG